MVFNSGMHIVLVPLEVTHTAVVTQDILDEICLPDTEFSAIVREILLFFKETYKSVFGFDAPPLHDPCAVAYVIAPEIFKVCIGFTAAVCELLRAVVHMHALSHQPGIEYKCRSRGISEQPVSLRYLP